MHHTYIHIHTQDLLFGEMAANPLQAMEALLSHAYKPMIEAADGAVWGKADEENKVGERSTMTGKAVSVADGSFGRAAEGGDTIRLRGT